MKEPYGPTDGARPPIPDISTPRSVLTDRAFASHAAVPPAQTQPGADNVTSLITRLDLPDKLESVSCIYWEGIYYITGTDIVRALAARFELFGRRVLNMKKFEEGIFSDLRNLKPGIDASLEESKSPLLEYLFMHGCIRTQKKIAKGMSSQHSLSCAALFIPYLQVFFWFSVPHNRLFIDALERDLKREASGAACISLAIAEPASSLQYDPNRDLLSQSTVLGDFVSFFHVFHRIRRLKRQIYRCKSGPMA